MTVVRIDIGSKCPVGRACVDFSFRRDYIERIKEIGGAHFVKVPRRHWHVPLDLETCRRMRELFGDDLVLGPAIKAWGKKATRTESRMQAIVSKNTAELDRLPHVLPSLYDAIHLGPLGKHMTEAERAVAREGEASYQAADVEFLAHSPAPLNANEQGTGKTIEWIAAVWEAGIEEGDHLIICPKAAADGTWEPELEKWQAETLEQVGIFMCVADDKAERQAVIERWQACTKPVKWVVVNPHMLMWRKEPAQYERDEDGQRYRLPGSSPLVLAVKGKKKEEAACRCFAAKGAHEHYEMPFPELFKVTWRTICIDEAHRGVIRNHRSLTAKSLKSLKLAHDGKKCAMSGTPMKKLGGADIWGILNWLRPKEFSSYWRLAMEYFVVTDNGFGKKVGKLREERQEAFFRMLIPYALRRTKKECAPWLPDKHYVDVNVHMTKRQATQYKRMHDEAMVRLGREEVVGKGTLAVLTRLKQFANAHCKVNENGDIVPIDSPKVDAMLQKMEEIGMWDDPARKQLVFSQSRRMVEFIADRLRTGDKEHAPLETLVLAGGTKDRKALIDKFQNGSAQVFVIVTTAGGVSLTLDAADEVHLIDEMWSPDDDEQAEDRAHRVSRIHQVTVYTYRTTGTVDEDIAISKMEKKESHSLILDVRRRVMASRT